MRRELEKAEQAGIVQLLKSVGAEVWVLGTRRPKGEFQGTRQTPGIPDIYAIIPAESALLHVRKQTATALWVEVKAPNGRLRPAQREFREWCIAANVRHVTGGIDAVQNWLVDHGWLSESQRRIRTTMEQHP